MIDGTMITRGVTVRRVAQDREKGVTGVENTTGVDRRRVVAINIGMVSTRETIVSHILSGLRFWTNA